MLADPKGVSARWNSQWGESYLAVISLVGLNGIIRGSGNYDSASVRYCIRCPCPGKICSSDQGSFHV